eukprot:1741918-Pleurochrysis_carterae.AAC.1
MAAASSFVIPPPAGRARGAALLVRVWGYTILSYRYATLGSAARGGATRDAIPHALPSPLRQAQATPTCVSAPDHDSLLITRNSSLKCGYSGGSTCRGSLATTILSQRVPEHTVDTIF